ncbi:MAG: hypothetical protein QOE22_705 [Candidatus Parcubacteria bacterium]|jgi:hypothetical protein|nr:hypothetical protein [Candidatus Parcubacteria bacterium]
MAERPKIYLAPRSNETSQANFIATLASGYPRDHIHQYLSTEEEQALGVQDQLYIWGSGEGRRFYWDQMQPGDSVLFYAKGVFVYTGKCILKKQSAEIARALWGNIPQKEETWEYLFFLDELRPIQLPLEIIRELGAYDDKMVVQGFVSLREGALDRIYATYGSLDSFFDAYSPGLKAKDVALLDSISGKEDLTASELAEVDALTRDKEEDSLLLEWQQRHADDVPESVARKVTVIKRNVSLVRRMKEKYKNECQICGFTFRQRSGNLYSEVAHIVPIAKRLPGADLPSNMLVLCPNHHKMLDLGDLKVISATQYQIGEDMGEFRLPMNHTP